MRRLAASIGAAAVLVTAACGSPSAGSGSPATGGAAPAGASPTTPVSAAASPSTEFDTEFTQALELVTAYWRQEFTANNVAFAPVKDVRPYTKDGELSCAGQPLSTNNAFYCPPSDLLGYDVNFVRAGYDKIGDGFLYLLLAHEYGHAIQTRVNTNRLVSRVYELQADCLAGAVIGDSTRAGTIELERGDADEIMTSIMTIADPDGVPWFDPTAHGSNDDRLAAFSRGYRSSYGACHLDSLSGVRLIPSSSR
jgi:predicted metalloprotease